jgi:hypothetical protein
MTPFIFIPASLAGSFSLSKVRTGQTPPVDSGRQTLRIMVNFWRKVNHHEVVYDRNSNQFGAIGELSRLPKIAAS